MIELGVIGYEGLHEFSGPKKMLGAPPCLLFNGDEWDRIHDLGKLRNLLLGKACSVGQHNWLGAAISCVSRHTSACTSHATQTSLRQRT